MYIILNKKYLFIESSIILNYTLKILKYVYNIYKHYKNENIMH